MGKRVEGETPMPNPTEEGPFELKQTTTPRVRVEGGVVYVRLELSKVHDTYGKLEIEILLPPRTANELGAELIGAAKKAP
jgi:hypothetical protein